MEVEIKMKVCWRSQEEKGWWEALIEDLRDDRLRPVWCTIMPTVKHMVSA